MKNEFTKKQLLILILQETILKDKNKIVKVMQYNNEKEINDKLFVYNVHPPTFLRLKERGEYNTQELNINFLSSYVYHHFEDSMIEYKLYV